MKIVNVVCGFAYRDGKALMGKRLPTTTRPDLWEYPGGKVDAGETLEEALVRELQEELGISAKVGELISVTMLDFEVRARLFLYAVEFDGPAPGLGHVLNSHTELRWVDPLVSIKNMPLAPSAYLAYRDVLAYLGRHHLLG